MMNYLVEGSTYWLVAFPGNKGVSNGFGQTVIVLGRPEPDFNRKI